MVFQQKVHIVELRRTCIACPSQWEGTTHDGREIYIRYRHGNLTVQLGKTIDDALQSEPIINAQSDDEWDGFLTEDALEEAIKPFVSIAPDAIGRRRSQEELQEVGRRASAFIDRLIADGTLEVIDHFPSSGPNTT